MRVSGIVFQEMVVKENNVRGTVCLSVVVRMAQWIRRLPTEQEIPGSSPGTDYFYQSYRFAIMCD